MTLTELLSIDLEKPHPHVRVGDVWVRFKAKDINGCRFYIPTYISLNGNSRPGWQVRIERTKGKPTKAYFSAKQSSNLDSLNQAWAFVITRLMEGNLTPRDTKRVRTSVDTGVVGVWLGTAKPGNTRTLMLRVAQSTVADKARNEVFYSVARDGTNREHFLACYKRAIAARRYYEELRQTHYRLDTPITRETHIPDRFFPDSVPVPDLLEKALRAAESKTNSKPKGE